MKAIGIIISIALISAAFSAANCRRADVEKEIRRLDAEESDAIKNKDIEWLNRLTSDDFTVNSPRNELVRGRAAVIALMVNGVINYRSFNREIESIAVYGDTAIVMGHEDIITEDQQIINRRYTNIWIKQKGKWLLTARHASVICDSN